LQSDGEWEKGDPIKFSAKLLQGPQRNGQNTIHFLVWNTMHHFHHSALNSGFWALLQFLVINNTSRNQYCHYWTEKETHLNASNGANFCSLQEGSVKSWLIERRPLQNLFQQLNNIKLDAARHAATQTSQYYSIHGSMQDFAMGVSIISFPSRVSAETVRQMHFGPL